MLFNSFPFLLLVLVTLGLYYLPALRRYQIGILILSSGVFYAYGQPWLLLLLLLSAGITGICSYRVLNHTDPIRRRVWAVAGVLSNLLVLAFFKYNKLIASAMVDDLSNLGGAGQAVLTLALPIGISFYTFQGISLMVDVFRRGTQELMDGLPVNSGYQQHLGRTLLYITFFPQLVAGPIVKAHDFYPQIQTKLLSQVDWALAVRAMITGYFLKMVIADNLHDQTFWIAYPYFLSRSSIDLAALLFGYSMQIFADFAGYSLIAIGVAALFGYRLPQNFNFPYIAQSVAEFWRRWHISLSSWLREYLYYSLGGNRKGRARLYLNLMIVMFLGGLWHGAAWSYAVWGAWHGVALAVERPLLNSGFYTSQHVVMKVLRIGLIFLFVSLSWLLFKLPEFTQVVQYLKALGSNLGKGISLPMLSVIMMYSLPVIAYHLLYLWRSRRSETRIPASGALYGVMLFAIVYNSGTQNAFIYFQF